MLYDDAILRDCIDNLLPTCIDEGIFTSRLPPELQYTCRYWVDHLEQSQQEIADGDVTHVFLQKHFLHWFEIMSLMRESTRCVYLLKRLETLLNVLSLLKVPSAVLTRNTAISKHCFYLPSRR